MSVWAAWALRTATREGMAGKVGIGKLAISGREYLVAIRPQGQGFIMYTLHHAAEIRPMSPIDELKNLPRDVKSDEIRLAKQVISAFDRQLDLSTYHDAYREGLQQIIDANDFSADDADSIQPGDTLIIP